MEHFPDYTARLWAVTQLGRRFPGIKNSRRSGPKAIPEDLGLFAGIYLQTLWQKNSGRNALPIWHVVNESLTVAAYQHYREYSANPDSSQAGSGNACRAWKEYFKAADTAAQLQQSSTWRDRVKGFVLSRILLPRKLWRAHVASVRYAIGQNLELLNKQNLPAEERAFWRGWVRLVMVSGLAGPPTTDFLLEPLLAAVMPPHAPLGDGPLANKREPLLRRAGLRLLMAWGRNEERFFASFGKAPR